MASASFTSFSSVSFPPMRMEGLNKRLDKLIGNKNGQIESFEDLGYQGLEGQNPGLEKFAAVMMKNISVLLTKCTKEEADGFLARFRVCFQDEKDVDNRLKDLAAFVRAPFQKQAVASKLPAKPPVKSFSAVATGMPKAPTAPIQTPKTPALNNQSECYHRFFDETSLSELKMTASRKLGVNESTLQLTQLGTVRDNDLGITITIYQAH